MPDSQIPQKPGVLPDEAKAPSFDETRIRTMPEKYIGATSGRPPVVREIVEKKTVVVAPPKTPPPPKPPAKKVSRRLKVIIAAAVVLLAGAGSAAYILFAPKAKTPLPVNVNQPPVNVNVNVNVNKNVNVPPPPVCGNSVLETGEECDLGADNGKPESGCSVACKAVAKTPPPPPNTGVDSDSDGLTDIEEKTIYGTDPYSLDSDHDTFNDGNEASHLYDPMVKAPAMLKDSKAITVIENKASGYSIFVPAKWSLSGAETQQLMAAAPTGEFFEVLVTAKPDSQSLVEWFLAMSPGTSANDVERFKTLEGYDALRSPDRLTTYVDPGNGSIYTLVYSYDDQTKLEFRTTYEAFIGSFEVMKP